jgi:hypothetical protein
VHQSAPVDGDYIIFACVLTDEEAAAHPSVHR